MAKSLLVLPYLQGNGDRITSELPWISSSGIAARNGLLSVTGWDCNTALTFNRRLRIDWAGLSDDCRLSDSDRMQCVVTWQCVGGTGLRGKCYQGIVVNVGEARIGQRSNRQQLTPGVEDINARFDGPELGGTLVLKTQILLSSPGSASDPFAPIFAGSVLWQDRLEVALDSSGERFPVEMVDFEESLAFPKEAAWRLDWYRADLNLPLMGGMCLRLNVRKHNVRKAVTANPSDFQDNLIRSVIKYDVARAMLHGALEDQDFLQFAKGNLYEEGSIGKTIQRLAQVLFPNDNLDSLAELIATRFEEFDARLQAALGLFSPVEDHSTERS